MLTSSGIESPDDPLTLAHCERLSEKVALVAPGAEVIVYV